MFQLLLEGATAEEFGEYKKMKETILIQ